MFTQNDLNILKKTVPFTAFRLHLSDGGHIDVLSPESVVGQKRTVFVAIDDERWTILYYMHITRAEMLVPNDPFSKPPSGPSEEPSSVS